MADSYDKGYDHIRKMLEECISSSEYGEESEEESDHLEVEIQISDSDCVAQSEDSEEDAPLQTKRSKKDGWLGKDKVTWWEKIAPTLRTRTRSHNVVTAPKGITGPALDARTPLEFWSLFMTAEILEILVVNTNVHIRVERMKYSQKSKARDTDHVEMKAFLGLLLLAGIYHSNRMNLDDLWNSDGTGVEIFRAAFSLHRFRFLLLCLRFDDKITRPERRLVDKLAPIRDLFEKFVESCVKNYSPSEFVAIDEMLVAFRGKCPFRQYIPNKPAKYGIKIQAMADAMTYYVCKMEIYAGMQPDGQFKLNNSPLALVPRLISTISGSGRNVTMDNWYTSFSLAQNLLKDHNLTIVGTLRKNKREIPEAFIQFKGRPEHDSIFGFQKDITLVSHVPKKGKVVLLLSTMHHDSQIDPSTGQKNKPEINTFYNKTKGGVDMVDQLSAMYNASRNSRRWPLTVFFHLINVAGINSYVLYSHNSANKLCRRFFLKKIAMDLISDYLQRRLQNLSLRKDLRESIKRIMPEAAGTPEQAHIEEPQSKKRCKFCQRSKDRKVKTICNTCGENVCSDHSKVSIQCCSCEKANSIQEDSD